MAPPLSTKASQIAPHGTRKPGNIKPVTGFLPPGFRAASLTKTGEHVACHRVFPYPDAMIRTIEWTEAGVVMLDQRLLPAQEIYNTYTSYEGVAEAIRSMVIRGAPAIGVAAAMGIALGVTRSAA